MPQKVCCLWPCMRQHVPDGKASAARFSLLSQCQPAAALWRLGPSSQAYCSLRAECRYLLAKQRTRPALLCWPGKHLGTKTSAAALSMLLGSCNMSHSAVIYDHLGSWCPGYCFVTAIVHCVAAVWSRGRLRVCDSASTLKCRSHRPAQPKEAANKRHATTQALHTRPTALATAAAAPGLPAQHVNANSMLRIGRPTAGCPWARLRSRLSCRMLLVGAAETLAGCLNQESGAFSAEGCASLHHLHCSKAMAADASCHGMASGCWQLQLYCPKVGTRLLDLALFLAVCSSAACGSSSSLPCLTCHQGADSQHVRGLSADSGLAGWRPSMLVISLAAW